MSRKFIILLFLTLPLFAHAEKWQDLIINEHGSIYFSPESFATDALDRTTFWVKFNIKNPKKDEYPMQKMLVIIDCKARTTGISTLKSYNALGNLVKTTSINPIIAPMSNPDPDDFSMLLLKGICDTKPD